LNQALIEQVIADDSTRIAVVNGTFTEKSGRYTLDWFYKGKMQRPERGVEWSVDLAQTGEWGGATGLPFHRAAAQ